MSEMVKEEFEPYFVENLCFFGEPKEHILPRKTFWTPKTPTKETNSP